MCIRDRNAAFAARALDLVYVALDVPPERLEEALRGLRAAGFVGANVTAPHKLAVARLVGAQEPSVNTLVFGDDGVRATSTDAAVVAGRSFERPVVIGEGGSAQAFLRALPHARVFSRLAWLP